MTRVLPDENKINEAMHFLDDVDFDAISKHRKVLIDAVEQNDTAAPEQLFSEADIDKFTAELSSIVRQPGFDLDIAIARYELDGYFSTLYRLASPRFNSDDMEFALIRKLWERYLRT